jgi:hypothetical protein
MSKKKRKTRKQKRRSQERRNIPEMKTINNKEIAISPDILKFGVPAAERDEDLFDCFVFSDSYNRIKTKGKNVILGNRGTGKSALFRKLKEEEEEEGNFVIELPPEDYSYELLSQTMRKESEGSWVKHGAYSAAWKYLIYVTIMKRITEKGPRLKKGSSAKIYEYLRDNHKNPAVNPIGILISYLKRLEGLKIGNYEAALKTEQLQSLYKLEEISHLIPLIEEACERKHVFVLVDELDKGWDGSEDAVSFVAGLFQAATSINSNSNNIRVLISLRKELYDNIPALYEDAQKVRDLIETIEWDEPTLLELIARRIEKLLPYTKELDFIDRWNLIFADTIDYRKAKSFNYIVDRTLYRPREMIQFCNDIKEKSSLLKVDCPFNYKVIAESENGYSDARLKDIASEYRFQYPELGSVFETFRGLSYNFTKNELEEHCMKIVTLELPVTEGARGWCEGAESEFLIDTLWKIGFLRGQAVGGLKARRRSGSTYLGSHQISNLNLRNIQRFHVHPMFRSYLGMKESRT